MPWDPEQYLKFAGPRIRPAVDLLGRVHAESPRHVYDLGCGAGNVTRLLLERWPEASVTGVDDSSDMLARAAATLPRATFRNESVAAFRADPGADVVYSNAALHWLPDHDTLFPAVVDSLASGGVLAVQMPNNFAAPSHTSILETVRSGPWRDRLLPLWRSSPVQPASFYYSLLAPLCTELDIWETEYLQVLEGADPVKEWTKGTWLKPFLDALPEKERAVFEIDYAERVRRAYPPLADGKTLFPFRRLFIVGTKR